MIKDVFVPLYDGSGFTVMFADPNTISPDSFGVKWGLFDIDGWNNAADVRAAVFDRPFQDGAVLDDFTYAPRIMDFHGGLSAASQTIAITAVRRLKSMFEVRDSNYGSSLRRLFVEEYAPVPDGSPWQYIDVRRQGAIEIHPFNAGKAFEFSVPLIAPDPRKFAYNQQHVTATGASPLVLAATGQGDTPTYVELVITGPVTNPVVTHNRTGWHVNFTGSLAAGQTVTLNTRDHTAVGTLTRQNITFAQWFPLLPGANTYTLTGTGTTGATKLEAFWYNAAQ